MSNKKWCLTKNSALSSMWAQHASWVVGGESSIPQPLELDPIDIGAHTCYKCTIYFNNGNKNFMNDNVDVAITIYNGAESSICIGDFEKL